MKPVPFFDLSRQYAKLKPELDAAAHKVFEKNAFIGGPFVEAFEEEFAEYCGTKYAVAVNSGTAAIHLATEAHGISAGDEVIVPANTYIATAMGVSHAGGTPVFADCTADTWELDVEDVERKITDRTKAIMPVHLFGQPVNMDAMHALADKHQLLIIEDAAQAHGAAYKDQQVGTFGNTAGYSFYPSKNLGAYGEGGGLTTDDKNIYNKLQKLKDYGRPNKYEHDFVGYNQRMHGMQAAYLSVKLPYLDGWNDARRAIAKQYHEQINNPVITKQAQPEGTHSVYHLFVVTVEDREHFTNYLNEQKIGWGTHYPIACHLQKAYAHLGYKVGDMPNSEYLSDHCVSLPLFPEMEQWEVDRLIAVLNSYQP